MSIYRFDKNSLIDELTVRHTEGGGGRAYLHARAGASPEALEMLKKALTAQSLQWTPMQENGKPVLEVRGFRGHEGKLLKTLAATGAIPETHHKEKTPDDTLKLKDRIKRNTLRGSGLLYFVGDAGFLTYGWKDAFEEINGKRKLTNRQVLLAGIFYAMGSPVLALFGRGDKSDVQLKHLSFNLINELHDKGVGVPVDSSVRAVANGHNATFGKKIHTAMERYPAEIANSMFGLAGSMIMWEKIKQLKKFEWSPREDFRQGGLKQVWSFLKREQKVEGQTAHSLRSVLMDIGLGSMSVIAGLVSVFIEEEVPKPEDEKKTGIMGLLQKVKQRPLAAASTFLMGATAAHGASTYVDWKDVKNDLARGNLSEEQLFKAKNLKAALPGRATFVATNLAAEALMAISSKGHGNGVKSDSSMENSSYAVAADLINRTDPRKREDILKTVTKFLSNKKHLAGDPGSIEKGIREQLVKIHDNPWATTGSGLTYSIKDSETDDPMRWRSRIAQSQQPAPVAVQTIH